MGVVVVSEKGRFFVVKEEAHEIYNGGMVEQLWWFNREGIA